MAIPSRTAKSGTYFITTATHNRRQLFHIERNAELETIAHHKFIHSGRARVHACQ